MNPANNLTDANRARQAWLVASILALLLLAQGFYAVHLNKLYYQSFGPFYDSVAYTNRMADFYKVSRAEGFLATLPMLKNETIALAFIEVALVAPLVDLSRTLGVWLQSIWLIALALSVYYYLHRHRHVAPWLALCLTLPLVSFQGIYHFNGGLSDFRMDLSQYIFFGLLTVWYLVTYETDSLAPWLLAGIFGTLGCFARSTIPVHFVLAIGPLAAWRLIRPGTMTRARLLAGIACMAGLPALLAGSFFLYNFARLYEYYVQINLDANANLPLRTSVTHFYLVAGRAGKYTIEAALVCCLVLLRAYAPRFGSLASWVRGLDWKMLYIGIVPALFLVLRGAGLNPFVSMPSLFGLILFAVAPVKGSLAFPGKGKKLVAAGLLVTACLVNAWTGVAAHAPVQEASRMDTLKQIIHLIQENAARHDKREVYYATLYVGALHFDAFRNVLIYEFGGAPGAEMTMTSDANGLVFRSDRAGALAIVIPRDWENLPGDGDGQKVEYLARFATEGLDYLLFPDEATLHFVEKDLGHNLFNMKTRALCRKLLESGNWEKLSGPLVVNTTETVYLYVNTARK